MGRLCIFCFQQIIKCENGDSGDTGTDADDGTSHLKLTICDLFKLPCESDGYLFENPKTMVCLDCIEEVKNIEGFLMELKNLKRRLEEVKGSLEGKILQSQLSPSKYAEFTQAVDFRVFEVRNKIHQEVQAKQEDNDNDSMPLFDVNVEINEDGFDEPNEYFDDDMQSGSDVTTSSKKDKMKTPSLVIEPLPLHRFKTRSRSSRKISIKNQIVKKRGRGRPKKDSTSAETYNVKDKEIVQFIRKGEKTTKVTMKRKNNIITTYERARKNRKLSAIIPDEILAYRHSKESILPCRECGKTFGGKEPFSNLKQHYLLKHSGTDFRTHTCPEPECNKSYVSKYLLINHMKTHSTDPEDKDKERNHTCSLCGKSYLTKETLIRHQRYHGIGKPLKKCQTCGKGFASTSNLSVHLKKHTKIRDHLCHICSKGYKSKLSLDNHILVTHGGGTNELLYCTHEGCDRKFPNPELLEEHIKERHEKVVNFVCNLCGLGFFSETKLKRHVLYHPGVLRFECQFCSKKYSKPDRLADHMACHNKERGLPEVGCHICSKTFRSIKNLKRHLKNIHSTTDYSNVPAPSSVIIPIPTEADVLKSEFDNKVINS